MKQKLKEIHKIKLSKELKWLWPYLECVSDIVPFDKIKVINYYKNRKHHKKEHHKAITHLLGNNKSYRIYIRTTTIKTKRIPVNKDTQEDILWFLAHELAHCCPEGWEHTKEHFKIMSEIFYKFGLLLYNLDFEDERNK